MIQLVTGGTRSGKTDFAQKLLGEGAKIYLATAQVWDEEMAKRVERHQAQRGSDWTTLEGSTSLVDLLPTLSGKKVLLDSITTWVALAMERDEGDFWLPCFDLLLAALRGFEGHLVIVTDEVGLGVVPPSPAGRRFRDLLGALNQRLAAQAQEVFLVCCGLSLQLK